MPVISINTSLATATTNTNVLAGSQFEFLPYDALVEFGFTASATGLILNISSGTDILASEYVPLIKATSPIYPDDFVLTDEALAGDRLVVSVRNPTGGTLTIFTTVRIEEL